MRASRARSSGTSLAADCRCAAASSFWLCLAGWAQAQPVQPVPKTTAYTREFLTNSTAAEARAKLGLASTNVGVFIDFNGNQFQTNGMVLALTNGVALTNAMLYGMPVVTGTSMEFNNTIIGFTGGNIAN